MLDNKNFYNNFLKIAAIHHIQKGLIYVSIPFKGIFNFSNEYGGEKKQNSIIRENIYRKFIPFTYLLFGDYMGKLTIFCELT